MNRISKTLLHALRICIIIVALLLGGVGPFAIPTASAAQLQDRTLRLSNSIPGQTSNYEISMDLPTAGTLGSIRVEFCSNLALLYYPCTAPVGFNVSSAVVAAQTGVTGFAVDPSTTANILILTRLPSAVPAGNISITLSGVTNQSAEGSSFARYYTYAANDGSGPVTDDGAVAYTLNEDFGVSAEVPPYLMLCVAIKITNNDCSVVEGSVLQMGQFSPVRPSAGQSQFVVTTNADDGYTVRVQGQTMTSGNNVIPAMGSVGQSIAGTNQFGINLRSNSNPSTGTNPTGPGIGGPTGDYGQTNVFKYSSGDIVASGNSFEDYRRYTVTYLVNINRSQPPGIYASSFSYIALGNF